MHTSNVSAHVLATLAVLDAGIQDGETGDVEGFHRSVPRDDWA